MDRELKIDVQEVSFIAENLGFRIEWCEKAGENGFKLFLLGKEKGTKYLAKAFTRKLEQEDIEKLQSELYGDIKGLIFALGDTKSDLKNLETNNITIYSKEDIASRLKTKKQFIVSDIT